MMIIVWLKILVAVTPFSVQILWYQPNRMWHDFRDQSGKQHLDRFGRFAGFYD